MVKSEAQEEMARIQSSHDTRLVALLQQRGNSHGTFRAVVRTFIEGEVWLRQVLAMLIVKC